MIPRPAHIQGQLGKGIEPVYFGGQKIVDGVAGTGLFAHDPALTLVSDLIPECINWDSPRCAGIRQLRFPAAEEGPVQPPKQR
jgi:hypothetical protein